MRRAGERNTRVRGETGQSTDGPFLDSQVPVSLLLARRGHGRVGSV